MNQAFKEYIEDNIELIDSNEWKNFFNHEDCPNGIGEFLYINDVKFLHHLNYLPEKAFSNSIITIIDIPDNIMYFEDHAFHCCRNLLNINIPDEVVDLGEYVFYSCRNLKNVTIPNNVTHIRDYSFHDCRSITSIIVPDGVKTIGDFAFDNCLNLSHVTIPNSLTSIGATIFGNCKNLVSIIFKGTKKQWNAIQKHYVWDCQCSISTIHCTDGDIKL